MPLRRSSLPFVPFTLGVGLLSRVFGGLGDKIGALLIAGPAGAALAYVWTVDQTDEGLASGINNAAKRIAQLAAVTLAAGVASFASGYEVGLIVAAATSIGGAFTPSITLTPAAAKAGGSGGVRKHGIQPDSIFPKPGRHP
jgi:hypothetical protein